MRAADGTDAASRGATGGDVVSLKHVNRDPFNIGNQQNIATEVAMPVGAPVDRPDYLAGALLQSLMRPYEVYAPKLLGTILVAIVTMGIGPLLMMPRRLRSFAARERDQLLHLGEWMRLQFGSDAHALDPQTPGFDGVIYLLRLVSWGAAMAALASLVWYIRDGLQVDDLVHATFGYFRTRWHPYGRHDEMVFAWWTGSLSIGYAAHWLAIQLHQSRIRRFVERFNEVAQKQSFKPVAMPKDVLGLRPVWLLAGAGFLGCGVLWGVPLMLAGAAQSRYIKHRSRWTRADLAQRVRDVLRTLHPSMILNVPMSLRRKCPVNLCQAPLPQAAVFCPRCGMRVAAVDRVA
jgi:hypothetical protein